MEGVISLEQIQPILAVDDEFLIRMHLVDVLEAGGFTVLESATGAAAVAEIDSRDFLHGLVTDVNLGSVTDGWSVARHARTKFPSLAVVYITGDSAEDWSSKGVPNSIMLQKPFADAQLINAVATLLGQAGPQATS